MNFINQNQSIIMKLPNNYHIIIVDKISPNGKLKTLMVEQKKVHGALLFLKGSNQFFKDIEINEQLFLQRPISDETELMKNIENLFDTCNYLQIYLFLINSKQ